MRCGPTEETGDPLQGSGTVRVWVWVAVPVLPLANCYLPLGEGRGLRIFAINTEVRALELALFLHPYT